MRDTDTCPVCRFIITSSIIIDKNEIDDGYVEVDGQR